MSLSIQSDPVSSPLRDSVKTVSAGASESPAIVSISDIHGYLGEARSALMTLDDHPDFVPVVTSGDDGLLHWADENYVLVFNGDLVDRGPQNKETLSMVERLVDEAPAGRVRVTLGNHESMILAPNEYRFADWYSTNVDCDERKQFLQSIADGHVIAAYGGHTVTYAHAGATTEYDTQVVNDALIDAAEELRAAIGTMDDGTVQSRLSEDYPFVLGKGSKGVKGPSAGLIWMSWEHLTPDSPPQVVGHTRQTTPQTKGNVHCQDLIQNNRESRGGEGVFMETADSLLALRREADDSVSTTPLA
jgi:hypothetical protein